MLRKIKDASVERTSEIRERIAELTAERDKLTAEADARRAAARPTSRFRRAPQPTPEQLDRARETGEALGDIGLRLGYLESKLGEGPHGLSIYIPISGSDDLSFTENLSEEPPPLPYSRALSLGRCDGERYFFVYGSSIFVCDDDLSSDDATALLKAEALRQRRTIEQAKTVVSLDGEVRSGARAAVSVEVRNLVMRRDGGACVVCAACTDLQFDQIIPVAMGGGNDPKNLQILCGSCNRRKSATLG